jgi:hypothetical protein
LDPITYTTITNSLGTTAKKIHDADDFNNTLKVNSF